MSAAPTAESVLRYLCEQVVTDPNAVKITESETDDNVRFDVEVAADDMGRVIGRRGRVATAIRTVVNAAAAKDGKTSEVEFVE